jgi:hypothetical protein
MHVERRVRRALIIALMSEGDDHGFRNSSSTAQLGDFLMAVPMPSTCVLRLVFILLSCNVTAAIRHYGEVGTDTIDDYESSGEPGSWPMSSIKV